MHTTNKTTNKRKSVKKIQKSLNKRYKTIIRENNLVTLYVLMFALALIYVFPIIIYSTIYLVTAIVGSGIVLVGYVTVQRTIDYRQRSLPERLIRALPIEAFKYRSTAKVLGSSNQQWKLLEPTKQIEATEPDVIDIEPIKTVSFDEAYKQSDKYQWNIGQVEGTDQLATFNFTKQSHVLVCGGTNCGKTSTTGFMLALYALRSKFHVIVFDGANGADWKPFEQYVEFYGDAQPEHLETIISNIERLYDERQTKLKELGVADNYSMDKPLQPIVILIDELGFLLDGLKALDKNQYKAVVARIQKMIRVIRKVSIHLVLIDQNANSIPQEILTNIKCIFAYNAEGHIGNAIKRYNLDKLKAQGQFNYQGKIVDGWYTKQVLPKYLPLLKPVNQVLMLTDERLKDEDNSGSVGHSITDVVVGSTMKDTQQSNASLPPSRQPTVIQPTIQPTTPPKAVSNRIEFVNQLIEIAQSEQLNDSKVRKYCKELTGKSLDGVASKTILDYVNSQVQ